jgi:arylsulfatase
MGGITEIATSAPGYNSLRPNTCAPLAEVLKLNGYSTAQVGKCHEVSVFESGPIGPFDHWPNPGGGFEYFYGFIGGENNQFYPALYEQTTPIEPWGTPEQGYHLMEDLADKAILWLRQQKSMAPDKPFFMYFAPGATHAPHHVPPEWIDKHKGRFGQGWDAVREENVCAAEGARCDSARVRTDRAAGRDPRLGRPARRAEACAGARDGGLRSLPRVRGCPAHRGNLAAVPV